MLNIPWLHVKYTFNVVQNTLVYIKCIGTSQEVTKLQLILWLNEHRVYFSVKNPKLIQYQRMYNLVVAL
jgi:hypothetical protein